MTVGPGTLFPNPAPLSYSGRTVIAAETQPLADNVEPGTIWTQPSTGNVYVLTTAGVWVQLATGVVPGFATPAIALGTAAAAGAATTVIRSDGTIAAFDTTVPVTQALGDAAATGAVARAARRDHKHGMPALSTATPLVESGAGAAGAGTLSSRDDHVHPAAGGAGASGVSLWRNGATASNADSNLLAVPMTNAQDNSGGYWVVGTPTRITIPAAKAGVYIITGYGSFNPNGGGGNRLVLLGRNGAAITGTEAVTSSVNGGTLYALSIVLAMRLAVADYIELLMEHSGSGGNMTYGATTSPVSCALSAYLIGT